MHDFDYDVMQKKRIARNAKYQKNGSKSKKCTLPSDYLTAKERKALNGECKTYKMGEPMTYKEFKSMPYENQRLYITGLKQKFNVSISDLATLFNCSYKAIYQYLNRYDICTELFKKGGKRSSAHYDEFNKWLNRELDKKPIDIDQPVKKEVQYTNINAPKRYIFPEAETKKAPVVTSVGLTFEGPVSVEDLSKTLLEVLKNHADGRECARFTCQIEFVSNS